MTNRPVKKERIVKKKDKYTDALNFLEKRTGQTTLQEYLECIRLCEEWTKKEMADTIGVRPTYYSDLVAGKKPVSPRKAFEWGEKLGFGGQYAMMLAIEDQLKRQGLNYTIIYAEESKKRHKLAS